MKRINKKKRWILIGTAGVVFASGAFMFGHYEITKKPVAPATETITWTAPTPVTVPTVEPVKPKAKASTIKGTHKKKR